MADSACRHGAYLAADEAKMKAIGNIFKNVILGLHQSMPLKMNTPNIMDEVG